MSYANELAELQAKNEKLAEAHRVAQKQLGDRWADIKELQTTIARLTAENERLKVGQGEPVAIVTSVISRKNKLFEIDIPNNSSLTIGDKLYTSQPAPVAVALTEVRALLATTNYNASRDCHNAQVVGAACDLIDKVKELNT